MGNHWWKAEPNRFIIDKKLDVFIDSKGRRWDAECLYELVEAHYSLVKAMAFFKHYFEGWDE